MTEIDKRITKLRAVKGDFYESEMIGCINNQAYIANITVFDNDNIRVSVESRATGDERCAIEHQVHELVKNYKKLIIKVSGYNDK